jgi:protein-L-isoaspartate(D-aspartate) O-methyltransferase
MAPVRGRRTRLFPAALGAVAVCAATACRPPVNAMEKKRDLMVETQIEARGVRDPRVLAAMRKIPRHVFVPEGQAASAYDDRPLPIGSEQTISQPYVVAFMTEQLRLTGKEKVLEIGTGSGYQTAILAALAAKVYSIEIRPELAKAAAERLASLGIRNVEVRAADGYRGWPEEAPFDGILVTAAPERVPPPLLEQLSPTGRMVIPVGAFYQELKLIERQGGGYTEKSVLPVRFVPFVGEAEGAPAPPGTAR